MPFEAVVSDVAPVDTCAAEPCRAVEAIAGAAAAIEAVAAVTAINAPAQIRFKTMVSLLTVWAALTMCLQGCRPARPKSSRLTPSMAPGRPESVTARQPQAPPQEPAQDIAASAVETDPRFEARTAFCIAPALPGMPPLLLVAAVSRGRRRRGLGRKPCTAPNSTTSFVA